MSQLPSPGALAISSTGSNPNALYDASVPAAIVKVGPVQIDDENALITDPSSLNDAIFDEFIINSRFEGDGHRYMMGITSATPFQGNSAAFVQLASKTILWIVDWTVLVKQSLRIPDPELPIQDWVLLDDFYEPAAVVPNPDGITPLFRISGTYVYGCKNPEKNTWQSVSFPTLPWVKNGVFQTKIVQTNLDNTLIAPSSSAGGSNSTAPGQPTPNTGSPSIKTISTG